MFVKRRDEVQILSRLEEYKKLLYFRIKKINYRQLQETGGAKWDPRKYINFNLEVVRFKTTRGQNFGLVIAT